MPYSWKIWWRGGGSEKSEKSGSPSTYSFMLCDHNIEMFGWELQGGTSSSLWESQYCSRGFSWHFLSLSDLRKDKCLYRPKCYTDLSEIHYFRAGTNLFRTGIQKIFQVLVAICAAQMLVSHHKVYKKDVQKTMWECVGVWIWINPSIIYNI